MLLDHRQDAFKKSQGNQLRKARKSADMTQEQAATHFGISQDTISKYERGEYNIDTFRLLEFAKLYSKPITFFFMEVPAKPPSSGQKTDP